MIDAVVPKAGDVTAGATRLRAGRAPALPLSSWKLVAVAATVAVTVAACGSGAGSTAADIPGPTSAVVTPTDVAGLVDIGAGRSVYLECRGSGAPTVVLMAGKGNSAREWHQIIDPADPAHQSPGDDVGGGLVPQFDSETAVFPSVSRFTRVCAYDRPDTRLEGVDRSTPRAQPHSVSLDVSDLHALLAASGEPGPFVLVAHSYSGFIAELYTRTYPADVAGLVLVDPGSQAIEKVASPTALVTWDRLQRATSGASPEGIEALDAFQRIDSAPPMPSIPTTILSADKPWGTDPAAAGPVGTGTLTFDDWLAAQSLLATQLGAKHVSDTGSGHHVYLYSPELVTVEVATMVDAVNETARAAT